MRVDTEVIHDDASTVSGEQPSVFTPQPSSGARDDRDATFEFDHTGAPLLLRRTGRRPRGSGSPNRSNQHPLPPWLAQNPKPFPEVGLVLDSVRVSHARLQGLESDDGASAELLAGFWLCAVDRVLADLALGVTERQERLETGCPQ